MSTQPKLSNIQETIAFHQEELQQVSKSLSHQSETVVSIKNIIETLNSKLGSKHEETECLFKVDIGKFKEEIRRRCQFHLSVLEGLDKGLGKLERENERTKGGVERMERKLRELEEAVGL